MFELPYHINMHLHHTIIQIYSKIRKQKGGLRIHTKSKQEEIGVFIHKADVSKQKKKDKFTALGALKY